jgi:hypothetical protein
MAASSSQFGEFTERGYRELLEMAKARFSFEPFGTKSTEAHVLWRHDVDMSVHRALALAKIEAAAEVRSTWFLFLRSSFYNLLEGRVAARAREILALGHWLGLHIDLSVDRGTEGDIGGQIDGERRVLEDWLGHPVTAVSLHNPDVRAVPGMRTSTLSGLPNAYGADIANRYQYVSDSNGYWRFRPLRDVLVTDGVERLHVLTHPEWWTPEPMSPRSRVSRGVEGRARDCLETYDALLAKHGRVNLS